MEKKKIRRKKKSFNFDKVKEFVISIGDKTITFFKNLYNKFMALPLKVRYVTYVWVVVFVIIVTLIIAGSSNTKFLDKYLDLENTMNDSAVDYAQSNSLYPVKDNKLVIDLQILNDYGYIYESDIFDNTCEGYSVVYYDDMNDKYVVSSYLNCDKYTTKYYWDYR